MHFVAFDKFFVFSTGTVAVLPHVLLDVPGLVFIKDEEEQRKLLANAFPSSFRIQRAFAADLQGAHEATERVLGGQSREGGVFSSAQGFM